MLAKAAAAIEISMTAAAVPLKGYIHYLPQKANYRKSLSPSSEKVHMRSLYGYLDRVYIINSFCYCYFFPNSLDSRPLFLSGLSASVAGIS